MPVAVSEATEDKRFEILDGVFIAFMPFEQKRKKAQTAARTPLLRSRPCVGSKNFRKRG